MLHLLVVKPISSVDCNLISRRLCMMFEDHIAKLLASICRSRRGCINRSLSVQIARVLVLPCRFRREQEDLPPSYQREPKWKRIPPLSRTVELLHERDYLPAIWFIFSRASCDKAAQQVHASGAHLTSPKEQAAIQAMLTALK